MRNANNINMPISIYLPGALVILTTRRFSGWLAVALIVIGSQFTQAPVHAQTPANQSVPSAKRLPQALAVIKQTSKIDTTSGDAGGNTFFQHIKNVANKYSDRPIFNFNPENHAVITSNPTRESLESRIRAEYKFTGPDKGTFYDRKGRLRSWVIDKSAPGGMRVLESPPMELLRKVTGGLIDWGFESDYVGTGLTNMPLISSKPVLDQSYRERKNAKMWFSTKMGLSLSLPSPVEIDKEYYLRGKIIGKAPYPVTVRYWVDGEEKTFKEGNVSGLKFFMPLKFTTSGIHSFKVNIVDGDGKKRSRFINIPVAFKFTTDVKTSLNGGGRLLVHVNIKGSDGPFKAHFITSDGQKFEKKGNDILSQRIPNLGLNTVKWIDVVVEDIKAGYVVSKRIKLDDVLVELGLSASKITFAPEEKITLSLDIKGGEPAFKLFLYVNGKKTQARLAKNRNGQFVIEFDEPGTYSVYVDVVSKNIAGEKVSHTTQPLVLTVEEPETEWGSYAGKLTGKDFYEGTLVSEILDGKFNFTIDGTKVSGSIEGTIKEKDPLPCIGCGRVEYYIYAFKGEISGKYDPEAAVVDATSIRAKITGKWTGRGINKDESGTIREGYFQADRNSTGFKGSWSIYGFSSHFGNLYGHYSGEWQTEAKNLSVTEEVKKESPELVGWDAHMCKTYVDDWDQMARMGVHCK